MKEIATTKHQLAQRIFSTVFVALILFALMGGRHSSVATALSSGERISILLFGTDAADKSQHTDTLIVSSYYPLENSLSLISIPRDTRVHIPGFLFHRVNEIFGYHVRKLKNPATASEKVKEGVELTLSSEEHPVSIPYYVNVDYGGFIKLVDLVGGVWVDIDQPMHYDDNAGALHIHFEKGPTLLDGEKALRYVRFRGQTGDRGRILRQQEFLRNMVKRMANPMVIYKYPKMVQAVFSAVHTNLSFWDMVYLLAGARRVRMTDIGFYILPGQPRGAFWQIKRDTADRLMASVFYGDRSTEGYMQPVVPLEGQVTVNVWNASGKKGLAYQVTQTLRRRGFDVIDWGTFAVDQNPTRVIDRKGQISNARKLAGVLGVDNCHSEPNPNALVDVEVVLGRDYDGSAFIQN